MNQTIKTFINLAGHIILFLGTVVYFISGVVYTLQDFDLSSNCGEFSLTTFSIISLLFFMISGSIKFYKFADDNVELPLIFYILFFVSNIILAISGFLGSYLTRNCEIYRENLWNFNLISSFINLGLIFFMILWVRNNCNVLQIFGIKKLKNEKLKNEKLKNEIMIIKEI